MALGEKFRIETKSPNLYLSGYKGHFVTGRSHMNYYIDITSQKSRLSEAKAVARAIAPKYKMTTMVDTILCLDGTEVIGTCLANELTKNDFASINANGEINILTPEYTPSNKLIFRDNNVQMIYGQQVMIFAASVVTGETAKAAMEAISYYGGTVAGIASIFATVDECDGIPITSIFDPNDLEGYIYSSSIDCPMCRKGERVDALINSYGCSIL
ncbi:MAG: orotate phosphoribosyltransferase [Clostridia bacterium]|nr:orotate phosphoribosyltransferase [Clostridia bacterium]